jgi:signal transduction histidine kinase/DNA-binding response OmpR family regulator/HAMP domain-containing protein
MKISYRILLINFAIVVLIIGSSAIAFYSILYNVLSSQQSKYLNNSANNFVYFYSEILQNTDDDFLLLIKKDRNLFTNNFQYPEKNIDFIISANSLPNSLKKIYSNEDVNIPQGEFSVENFLEQNPFAVVKKYQAGDGQVYYYGRVLNENLINNIAQKIGADVAIIWKGSPLIISNSIQNQNYIYALSEAYKNLPSKSLSKIYARNDESADLLATLYLPISTFEKNDQLKFLIFTNLTEATDLRNNLKYVLIVIGISGVILSLILTLVFTDKIRKQITKLSKATEFTKEGKFKYKIDITGNDEIGKLANAFNSMMDVLSKNRKVREEYSEFITLINQNPTLSEISEAALRKIIKTCNFSVGAIYSVEDEIVSPICSYGLDKDYILSHQSSFFEPVINNKETLEFNFNEQQPIIKTGIISLQIKNLLIIPIVYNSKTIAVLELGAIDNPSGEAKQYLSNIQEQLAIGLTNAKAFVQLENFVAELKKLNEDYQKQNEDLLRLHHQLKEKAEELEIQKEKAEESTKLKSQFLAGMSHELRTPMNSILGLTELILEEASLGGKNKERLKVVLKSGKRLMNLITDILDLSKIEAGKMEVHKEDVSLNNFLSEIETSIKPLASKKSLEFKLVKHSNTEVIVNTDVEKLTQVLMNLLGNAVKFTENGFVELHITLENNLIKFDVADSGIGISKEDQKIIFDEFRQIDGTTTRKYTGTGLGLSITKRIAELLEGELSVQSEINNGSVFSFSLPLNLVRSEDEKINTEINPDVLQRNNKNPVLVIDDDAEVRYTIGQYLVSKGYNVVYAEDGEKGIIEAIRIQPFAITLDVMLPKKDGWNILRELKKNPYTKDIPVILISIISDKNLGFGLGAFEYFVKPISAQKLLSCFSKLEMLAHKKIKKVAMVGNNNEELEKLKLEFKNEPLKIVPIEGEEAFNKLSELQPDIILISLLMPNSDGITLTHKLKGSSNTRHIPIILSTSSDFTDEEKNELNNIMENITVTSHSHPLDVLKIVRDRLLLQEESESRQEENKDNFDKEVDNDLWEANDKNYFGEVLIVDDEPEVLFTVGELIRACNCKPILAKNGTECLEILKKKIPDLIMLDIMMPEMDGFQTLKKIKENQQLRDIPVFAVSAKAMIDDRDIILKNGFKDFIPKPVDLFVLSYKLKEIFNNIRIPENEKNISN